MKSLRRGATVSALAFGAVLLGATAALAHVTVSSPGATQGGYASVTFNVPTESDTASTVALSVQLPTATPFASVSVQPKAGWTHSETTPNLATPVKDDDGNSISEAVSVIDWKSADGVGIKPGEFDTFTISVGPMPKQPTVVFKVIQTYSDGTSVSWVEQSSGGAEPEHPAPTLTLGAASSAASSASAGGSAGAAAADSGSKTPLWMGVTAFSLGIVGAVMGSVALALANRRTRSSSNAD